MSALLGSVATYTVLATLLVASVAHLSRPAVLAGALATHRVLPAPATVAALVVGTEGLLAGTGIVALWQGDRSLLGVSLAGSGVLFGLYAGYGRYLLVTGRTGPCGCSRRELPMTGWVVTRALALAGLALTGLTLAGSVLPPQRTGTPLAVALLAAATFTTLLWHLPAAMHQPTVAAVRTRTGRPTGVTAEEGLPR
ncbi:MauE/DoxX family redox-associated membrane protein [Micromonospora echinofusca]|uniref:Methylamine utilization protein MauE n=1 Tax=Micromonospora echinofusca TaxID=47858 RepID=A0ABS3VT35_MICEH|nr:MauE/DoxX family redox-associated membrane protein [Micromonospora echinofusca]MBO4207681.1 methylamine utilization protein MauE [Micromonospora echinofusca]